MSEQPTERRRKRKSFGDPRRRLPVISIKGYSCRYVNDEPGRLDYMYGQDWDFVTKQEFDKNTKCQISDTKGKNHDTGSRVKVLVGTGKDGKALFAYLMKKRQEYFDEDQEEKLTHTREIMEQIKGGTLNEGTDDARYIPKGGISIESNL